MRTFFVIASEAMQSQGVMRPMGSGAAGVVQKLPVKPDSYLAGKVSEAVACKMNKWLDSFERNKDRWFFILS